jgi:hypothetical protein
MLEDRLIVSEEKVKKARMAQEKVEAPLQVMPADHKDVQDPLEHIVDQPGEVEVEKETMKKNELTVLEEIFRIYIEKHQVFLAILKFTQYHPA